MSITKIRRDIQKIVDQIDDKEVLELYLKLLAREAVKQEDFWDALSNDAKKAIEEGIRQADKGQLIPHAEMKKTYRKWL